MKMRCIRPLFALFTISSTLISCVPEEPPYSEIPVTIDISDQYIVTTLAGNGTAGTVDGPPASAEFNSPLATAVDGHGNVYVTEVGKYTIRKIATDGTVSTLAGGSKGIADGEGINAQFTLPGQLVVDLLGNIYVTDSTRVRKISPEGVVTTLAGGVSAGYADGNGDAARFLFLQGITLDNQGNIYVVDMDFATNSFQIRKITSEGTVSTFIEKTQKYDADASGTPFLAGNSSGNIYLNLGKYVYGITSSKSIIQVAKITVSNPYGFAVNSSNEMFITSSEYGPYAGQLYFKIFKITYEEYLIAGGADGFADGAGSVAQFSFPNGLSADDNGNVYLADEVNNRIRKIIKK